MPVKSFHLALVAAMLAAGNAQAMRALDTLAYDQSPSTHISSAEESHTWHPGPDSIRKEADRHLASVGARLLDEEPDANWREFGKSTARGRADLEYTPRPGRFQIIPFFGDASVYSWPVQFVVVRGSRGLLPSSSPPVQQWRSSYLSGYGLHGGDSGILNMIRAIISVVETGVNGTLWLLGVAERDEHEAV